MTTRNQPAANKPSPLRSFLPGVLLLGAGLLFLAIGIWRGQDEAVFQKAIRICLECIGIG